MDTQSVTQTINILVGGDLASTGASLLPLVAIGLALITASALVWHFGFRRSHKSHTLSFRSLVVLALFAVAGTSLSLNLHSVSATPTLSLATNQTELTVTIPEGGGTASTITTLTSGTTNPEGYTLTAALTEPESGIAIKLKGGNITTPTALTAGGPTLTLKTTNSATSNDTTDITLDFTIDSSVTPGKKNLKLAYEATDNGSTGPLTMQSFTTAQCNALPTYTGANEEAVITLSDPRGAGQTYQVAKLADGNCWMLDNLKLGSTTSTLELTSADTDIASNFTLPQVVTTGTADYDNPGVYGPIPGGEAGILKVSTGSNYSTSGTWSLVITAPIMATVGPFDYDVDADTVAAALEAVVNETVTTNNSGIRLESEYTTTFSWPSLTEAWDISIDTSNLVQDDGWGVYRATTKSFNYGYLYNWSAATAGESRTSHTEEDGDAPYSICPANWRLPKGGADILPLPTSEFNELSARMAGFPNGQDSTYLDNYWGYYQNWQSNGPFKGVLSGNWWEDFSSQGYDGALWSASAYPDNADDAFSAYFSANNVYPDGSSDRANGLGVRCLLQQP